MAVRADDVDLGRDYDLVVRSQGGDEAAFEELYRRYFDRLVRFCRRQVFDPGAAEELSQEAFARAYRNLSSLAGEKRFYPWLSVIARRLCVDHLRRTARVQPTAEVDGGVVAEAADGPVLAKETVGLIDSALARVKPRHREVIMLREFEELSYRDISDRMAAPVSTVETLLFRARQALRRELESVGAGRWAALPVFGALRRALARIKAACAGHQEMLASAGAPVAALAAAAIVAIAPATGPHDPGPTANRSDSPANVVPDGSGRPTADVAPPPGAPAPGAPAADGMQPSGAVPGSIDAGPVRVELGPDGAQRAQEDAERMPVFGQLGPAFVGADPPEPVPDDIPDTVDETSDTALDPLPSVEP